MNNARKLIESPSLTVNSPNANRPLINNIFIKFWRDIGMKTTQSYEILTNDLVKPKIH